MNKVLAFSILGMSLAAAVLIIATPFLFDPPYGNGLKMVVAGSTTVFVIFCIMILTLRRRLNHEKE
ncbi:MULTISPECIES: hypothetical protein [Bacillaceae]|uniref:Uncharacterized protein n=1 Tax=Alkalicoccobacillus plakortidis TaxID=444060 RepID=A0A9D5DUF6_9BACI|nr:MULTISPECIES: hypothetical protein [Bacillaceae]KQL56894.1 hypothetical protein AN965_11665 [Alkalicoccobacillus plakortidis]